MRPENELRKSRNLLWIKAFKSQGVDSENVSRYEALRKIGAEAWNVILPTFIQCGDGVEKSVGNQDLPVGKLSHFSERLLRDIC